MNKPPPSGRQRTDSTAVPAPRVAKPVSSTHIPTKPAPTQRTSDPQIANKIKQGSDRPSAIKTGPHAAIKESQGSDRKMVTKTGPQSAAKGAASPRALPRQHSSGAKTGKNLGQRDGGGPRTALKTKFMLIMACVTALAMIVLGMTMGRTANKYLEGQKTQDGIELARMSAQIAVVVRDRINLIRNSSGLEAAQMKRTLDADIRKYIEKALKDAGTWGTSTEYTDIEAIKFDCPQVPELSAAGFGEVVDQGVVRSDSRDVFIPKLDRIINRADLLKMGIQVYNGEKNTPSGPISILRFKIDLDESFLTTRDGQPANVRVDISKKSVDLVRKNLNFTIWVAIVLAIGAVLGIAVWFSSSITRPLERLLKDMQIVSPGRLGHRTTASSSDEVGLLASEFNKMTANLEEAQIAVIEQEKQAYELSLAREVQQQLLPAQPPLITGYQCQSFYQGAKAVSGDYFDFIPLANNMWGFIIADVSGKGIPGSMVMAVTRTVVRLVAPQRGQNAAETLKDTNRLIAKQIKRGMFVTSCYAVLDETTGQLTYASAGHNPMVIYRAKTRTAELATTKGIALGFNEGPVFDRTIQLAQTTLEKGDAIILYTDGFPEAMNAKNEEFGDDNFYRLIAANGHLDPPLLIEALVAGIVKHRGEAEQSDDLTLLTVRRT